MRLIITLESLKDALYDDKYYNKMQGLIYGCLRNTVFSHLHDLRSYKYFCFSNIFPIGDFREGDVRKLIISSPNSLFIETLKEELSKKEEVHIGELSFSIKEMKVFEQKLPKNFTLVSATPIILRIPPEKAMRYGITRAKGDIYWRPGDPIDVFLKQLEENIIKKYNTYYNTKFNENIPIFEVLEFVKSVVNHIIIDGREVQTFGSIWRFKFFNVKRELRDILSFAIDCGFGERNSFGFGFMNVLGVGK